VLDLRLYRVTLLPFAIGLIVVAFSLHAGPSALAGSQPAASFNAHSAYDAMIALGSTGGDPAPGSATDDALARAIAASPPPNGFAHANFQSVRVVRTTARTTAGTRAIDTVIATRFGAAPGIALIADRAGPGPASSLAATATLLEVADAFSSLATQRQLTLVSTSGGASALDSVAAQLPSDIEGAIVIGVPPTGPNPSMTVVPFSTAGGFAPAELRLTVEAALQSSLGVHVGDVPLVDQFARSALPLTVGPQGPLLAHGIPALYVTASASGEAGTPAAPATDIAALGAFGQGLVDATVALGAGPALATAPTRDLTVGSQVLDGWGVRLLAGLLLLSLAACTLDVLARALRRKAAVGRAVAWVLSCAAPFVLLGLFCVFLGAGGLLPARPAAPVTDGQLPPGGAGVAALVSVGLLFVLSWLLRAAVRRRRAAPEPTGAVAALLVTGCLLAFLVWVGNPYTALLVIVPLHFLLVALTRERRHGPLVGAVVLAVSLAIPVAALALVCLRIGISPPGLAWTLVLLIAGGGLSLAGLLLGGVACGCAVAAAVLLLHPPPPPPPPPAVQRLLLGYADPGARETTLRR